MNTPNSLTRNGWLLSDDFGRRMIELEGAVDLAGRSFNVSSPKQLGEILFEEMGLPGQER